MMRRSPRTKQGKKLLVVTAVAGAEVAEVAEDVEAVAEGAVVAGDVDGASRFEGGSEDAKDVTTQLCRDTDYDTVKISAGEIWGNRYTSEWLTRDARMKRGRMATGSATIAQIV
jgi:tetrahydromethanopterin S-methyltransferase subunit F